MTNSNSTTAELSKLVFNRLKGSIGSYPKVNELVLNKFFDILFYTSLKTEEGQFIKVTVTLIDPDNPESFPPKSENENDIDRWRYVKLKDKIEYSVKNLVKLSKAADVWSSSIAVFYDNENNLTIWGMIDQAVHYHSFLNYEKDLKPEQPGLFQSTIIGIGNIIVLFDLELIANLKQGTLVKNYIDVFKRGTISNLLEGNNSFLIKRIKTFTENEFADETEYWSNYSNGFAKQTLIRILLRIQNYQHGGAIIITDNFKSDLDIKYQIDYIRLSDSIERLLKLLILESKVDCEIDEIVSSVNNEDGVEKCLEYVTIRSSKDITRDELKGTIRFIASLSCVDGAVLLSKNMNVQGFGAVIKTKDLPDDVLYISKTSIINESRLTKTNPNNFGTRHRSMFAYCWANKKSIGFVVSQDGDIRVITRVEDKLIMWENIKVLQFIQSKKLKRSSRKKI